MKTYLAIYTTLILTIFALAYLGLIPAEIKYFPYYDSIGHFVLYGMWGYLAGRAFSKNISADIGIPTGLVVISIIAILEEFTQSFSAIRTFSFLDLTWGFLGILTATFLIKISKTF